MEILGEGGKGEKWGKALAGMRSSGGVGGGWASSGVGAPRAEEGCWE